MDFSPSLTFFHSLSFSFSFLPLFLALSNTGKTRTTGGLRRYAFNEKLRATESFKAALAAHRRAGELLLTLRLADTDRGLVALPGIFRRPIYGQLLEHTTFRNRFRPLADDRMLYFCGSSFTVRARA